MHNLIAAFMQPGETLTITKEHPVDNGPGHYHDDGTWVISCGVYEIRESFQWNDDEAVVLMRLAARLVKNAISYMRAKESKHASN